MFLSLQPPRFKVELLLIAVVKTEEKHCTTQLCLFGSTSHGKASQWIHDATTFNWASPQVFGQRCLAQGGIVGVSLFRARSWNSVILMALLQPRIFYDSVVIRRAAICTSLGSVQGSTNSWFQEMCAWNCLTRFLNRFSSAITALFHRYVISKSGES